MKLKIWLKKENQSVSVFAEKIGVSQATIYRYMSGDIHPRKRHLLAIMNATKGAVTPIDFLESVTEKAS